MKNIYLMYIDEVKCRNLCGVGSFSDCQYMVMLGLRKVEIYPTKREAF